MRLTIKFINTLLLSLFLTLNIKLASFKSCKKHFKTSDNIIFIFER